MPGIIPIGVKDAPPPTGIAISNDEDSVSDSLPGQEAESEGNNFDNGRLEPEPPSFPQQSIRSEGVPTTPERVPQPIASEGAPRSCNEYPPASKFRDEGGSLRDRSKMKKTPKTSSLTWISKLEPVTASLIHRLHKCQKYRQQMQER